MRKCWDLLLSRSYTVHEIHKIALQELGLTVQVGRRGKVRPIALNTLYRSFNNPFYYGHFEWDGQEWEGAHKPMVTREEYERGQEILGSRSRPREYEHQNPYPDLLRCGHCGRSIVLEEKRKKVKSTGTEKLYQYLRCSKNCSRLSRLNKSDVDRQLGEFVAKISVPPSFIAWALDKLKLSKEERVRQREKDRSCAEAERREAEKKINDLLELRLTKPDLFSDNVFQLKMQSLEHELQSCEAKLQDCDGAQRTWRDDFIDHLVFVEGLRERFADGGVKTRLEILHRLGQSLELKEGKVVCRLAEPYCTLIEGLEQECANEHALGLVDSPISNEKNPQTGGKIVSSVVIDRWSHLRDLNPGPSVYDTDALPLS